MPAASAYKPEQRIFALFVGRSGDGKSVAAASFPRPLFNLDFDMRFGGIAAAIKQGIITDKDMTYQQFPPRNGLALLNKQLDQFAVDVFGGKFPYKTVQTDSLTNLARLCMNVARKETKGQMIGATRMPGPTDYRYESTAVHDYFDFMRTFPSNILVTAHSLDRYGRPEPELDNQGNVINAYEPAEVVGEKLAVRDNLGETVLTYFDNVWKFSRQTDGKHIRFFVEFASDLAKNSFGIMPGKHDITNKNFYNFLMEKVGAVPAAA